MTYEEELAREESRAWQELCDAYCVAHGITRERMNKDDAKLRPFFKAVQRWGNHYFRLRNVQCCTGKWEFDCDEVVL